MRVTGVAPQRPGARHAVLLWSVGILGGGCTSLLGIDGQYISPRTSSGGAHGVAGASSGSGGAGIMSADAGGPGGMVGQGGTAKGQGGSGACEARGASCMGGKKCCSAPFEDGGITLFCATPAPIVGCSSVDCAPCPLPPSNAIAVCNGEECSIQCNPTYVDTGGQCESMGAGGGSGASGGAGNGAGGAPPICAPSKCTNTCSIAGPFRCCRNDRSCGCTWVDPAFAPPGTAVPCY